METVKPKRPSKLLISLIVAGALVGATLGAFTGISVLFALGAIALVGVLAFAAILARGGRPAHPTREGETEEFSSRS
ncbi:hypothetical protein [Pelagicoccus sp. SDUM812003]|uniref:hypothetical protein n=1 Tax=Pelagicoccus sp. SDUM812003 TaxID=3041267 RepID=UPI00280FA767|nr:hypothetical protein [Pelagicoccus sp. SDUM812003]MDQ8204332.1 hypothetical protein [Pelagicoccus sp. SDUM812003]